MVLSTRSLLTFFSFNLLLLKTWLSVIVLTGKEYRKARVEERERSSKCQHILQLLMLGQAEAGSQELHPGGVQEVSHHPLPPWFCSVYLHKAKLETE